MPGFPGLMGFLQEILGIRGVSQMPQLLKSAWQSVEPRPRWVGVKTQEEDWEKRGRERRHLWERLSACYFCHLQEFVNFQVVSAWREKCLSRVKAAWRVAWGQGRSRKGLALGGVQPGVEDVGQIRRLGLARQVGGQVWWLLQGSRSGI